MKKSMSAMRVGYENIHRIDNTNKRDEHQKKLFFEKNKFYGFKRITEEKRKEIEEKAQFWTLQNQELNDEQKLFTLYHFLNNIYKTNLKIEPNDECYLFLILAFDPELKLLQISFEESRKEEIKRRFQEEFNTYYDSRLLQIES